MIEPLRLTFAVDCPVDRAFTTWTARIGDWWPADHTVAGTSGLVVTLEASAGGRIFEQGPDGVRHDWGEVTV